MVQSLAGGSQHIPRSHQHVRAGTCSLCGDVGSMEWVMDTGEGSSGFLCLEAPIVSSPCHSLDKLGSLGFSLMPTPLGPSQGPLQLGCWAPGGDSCAKLSRWDLCLRAGAGSCWMCSACASQPESCSGKARGIAGVLEPCSDGPITPIWPLASDFQLLPLALH